ncbi:hypothetical protein AB0953_16655 [Streptomyces sp. NPDC046866]|uniref:hypothetical protein n=1 Tax=Streptomyces sp. NPDC046866 TaxID=3154921 RepID=UPI003454C4B1
MTARVTLTCRCGHSVGHNCPVDWSEHKHPQALASGGLAPSAEEYEQMRQRAERAELRAAVLVERIDDARAWARTNLEPERQHQLLAILGGREARP